MVTSEPHPTPDDTGPADAQLIRLLHQGASADSFARRLAQVDALPDDHAGKPALAETVRMAMAIRERLELLQQREHGMRAVMESAQALSSRLDLASLLGAIVARARDLLGADVAWLSVYDAARGEFHVQSADGAQRPTTAGMVTRHDRGVASVVMSNRLPFVTPDYLHDARFEHDANLDAAFRDEGIVALVGVPLVWDGEVTGLLFVADRYHRLHSAQSIAILCTLATHGAVALRNARDFERVNAALRNADRARDELERHMRSMQAATEAHEQLTSLLAKGATLSTVCESVARMLGGSLLVLDEAGLVVGMAVPAGDAATAARAYDPHGPRSAEVAGALRRSRETGRSEPAYRHDGQTCLVMPVVGGDDTLGAALLFHDDGPEALVVRNFERSAGVIGIVLLSRQRLEASKSHDASTLLRSLVWPRQGESVEHTHRAEHHGVDLSRPLALMLVEVEGPSAAYAARHFRTMRPLANALVDDLDGTLVVLCGATRAGDAREAISAWARTELRGAYRGVLSRPVGGPAEIPALYATLSRALPILGRIGVQGHVVNQNELALYSTLFETHDKASLTSFLEATIGPLLSHDRRRGAELTPTLLTYFDNNQNAKATAHRLGIHVNTVRQRLASVESILGHWGNAARALEIHIALRLWHLSTTGLP